MSHLCIHQKGFMGTVTIVRCVLGFISFLWFFLQQFGDKSAGFAMDLTRTQMSNMNHVKFLMLPY